MCHCFLAGIPVQGLFHDLSKYSPIEFFTGVKYYQGTRSPNVAERLDIGFSRAWMHHKGRNKHHFEYWFDTNGYSPVQIPVEMPFKYVIEMFCDRVGASKVYKGKDYTDDVSLKYFDSHDHTGIMHPNTEAFLRELLVMLTEDGEKATFKYIRRLVLKDKLKRLVPFSKK